VFALVEVPKHGDTVLATGCSQRTIRGDGDGVDVTSVAVMVSLQLELRKFPNLHDLVPSTRYDNGVQDVRAESYA